MGPIIPKQMKYNLHYGKKFNIKMAAVRAMLEFQTEHFFTNAYWVNEKKFETGFQAGSRGIHLGFPVGTFLTIFDLQVNLMLPTKFHVRFKRRSSK